MQQADVSTPGQVLVAIINDRRDFAIVREQNWYRIPVASAEKWLKHRWPPQWVAFYQTKIFAEEAYAIRYYARVLAIKQVRRRELFPNEPENVKQNWRYYQLLLAPLQSLPQPIFSRRRRRIVFIPTTWQKFTQAVEINDLYDESPLEDRLWAAFKCHHIPAERQEFLTIKRQNYALDFAIYCAKGKVDVETDGDSWHANPVKAAQDNYRDNALVAGGWKVLRFSTSQIQEEAAGYCVRSVAETINRLGGVDEGALVPRRIDVAADGGYQLGLFD